MLALCLMIAGIALILGAKEFAGKLAKGVVGAILILSALPCLLQSFACLLPKAAIHGAPSASGAFVYVLVVAAFVVVGFVAWRRRADRAKAHELWTRRNGAARARALPAAPSTHNEDHR